MGADIYIVTPEAEQYRDAIKPEWERAIRWRDMLYDKFQDRPQYRTGQRGKWPVLVEIAQANVERLSAKMWDDDPYYFRDSYNASSVMWAMDLSWWQFPVAQSDMCEDRVYDHWQDMEDAGFVDGDWYEWFKGDLFAGSIKAFIREIEARPITKVGCQRAISQWTENSEQEVIDYFVQKRAKLLAFLRRALAMGCPIYMSC